MRVLMLSTDRALLNADSAVRARARAYARALGNLDVVLFTTGSHPDIADGSLRIFPTNSASKWLYGLSAAGIAARLPKPDVVTAQDPFETGLAGYVIGKRTGAPLHVQLHTDMFSPEFKRLSLINRARIAIASFVLRRANRIRVVANSLKEKIEKQVRPHASISVLPIFVDIERFKNSVTDDALLARFSAFQTKVLVVSRFEPEKNVECAIRAFAKVAPESSCLILVGDGSLRKHLEWLVADQGVAERVFFEGRTDAAPYYSLADIVLFPSKYDGYGLVIIEALAAGKPVLSTDVGIAREAGAIVAGEAHFSDALARWFKNGPRSGELRSYPYKNFDEYVRAYCDDIRETAA